MNKVKLKQKPVSRKKTEKQSESQCSQCHAWKNKGAMDLGYIAFALNALCSNKCVKHLVCVHSRVCYRNCVLYTIWCWCYTMQFPAWFDKFSFFAHYIAFCNSAFNPIIYTGFNDNFKRGHYSMSFVAALLVALSTTCFHRILNFVV